MLDLDNRAIEPFSRTFFLLLLPKRGANISNPCAFASTMAGEKSDICQRTRNSPPFFAPSFTLGLLGSPVHPLLEGRRQLFCDLLALPAGFGRNVNNFLEGVWRRLTKKRKEGIVPPHFHHVSVSFKQ